MIKRALPVVCVIAALALAGCVHKSSGTITPMERVTTDNAVFAQLVNSIEQGTEAASSAGLVPAQQVVPVIAWCGNAAQIDSQISAVLAKGSTVSATDYASLQGLVAQLGTSASTLVSSGALAVKNPKTQQTISADINSASTLIQSILSEIQALTVTPPKPATSSMLDHVQLTGGAN